MEFGQLMKDILVNVSCKFEMYIFKIAQVINENVCIAFLYVLSIFKLETCKSCKQTHACPLVCLPDLQCPLEIFPVC